jgi:hypothetical protein
VISNPAGESALVEICESATSTRCATPPTQMTVPPYGNLSVPNPDYAAPPEPAATADSWQARLARFDSILSLNRTACKHYLVLRPKTVIVQAFEKAEGTLSTFNVDSSVSFGATVPEKKP